jgi:hypothetical protein
VNIPIGEFVTGWAGRTSQLFHGMIERWGAGTAFGPKPLTVAEFFARASDDYSFAPNLEPHFSLAFLRTELESLLRVPQVVRVALLPSNAEDEELAVRSVIVVSVAELPEVLEVGKRLRASEVGAAQAASLRQLGRISDGQSAIELRWD